MTNLRIPFAEVDCSGNERKYVNEVLERGWLTTGSMCERLESEVTQITEAKYAFAVNSCTSALHLAMEALEVNFGDKVFVPTLTFTASAEVIRYMGADPVPLDIDYNTKSINAEILLEAIERNPNVKCLIVVHFGGQAAPMLSDEVSGIVEICRANGIAIVEDAAHAFPAKDNGVMIGNIGDVTCLSFYANKTMTTGEGGMLLTNKESIADRVRLMRLHGIDRNVWDRFTKSSGDNSWEYDVLAPGFKYNMPDLNAAVGVAQLERLEEMRLARQRIAEQYLEQLAEIEELDLPFIRVQYSEHAWHLFNVVLKPNSKIDRDGIVQKLSEDGIGTSVHYKPLHRLTYYKDRYNLNPADYHNAERVWQGTFSIPIYSLLGAESQAYIISRIKAHLS